MGKLVYVSNLAPQSRCRLFYLFRCLRAGERTFRHRLEVSGRASPVSTLIRLDQYARDDLEWWKAVLVCPPLKRPILRSRDQDDQWTVTTDAAPSRGVGGHWKDQCFSIELSQEGKLTHSTYAELLALVVATILWSDDWYGETIHWRTDCQAHVRGLFKLRSKAPELLPLHDILDQFQFSKHFAFSSEHIPGEDNDFADALSRLYFETIPSGWTICHLPTTCPQWVSTLLSNPGSTGVI